MSLSKQLGITAGIVAAVVVGAVAVGRSGQKEEAAKPATDPNKVVVSAAGAKIADLKSAMVERSSYQPRLETSGQLSYPADSTVKVEPRLTGRVDRVFVKVGDSVTKGEPLATLDSGDALTAVNTALQNDNKLRQAKLDLERYERLYRLGTPDVTAAQASVDQAKEGETAAKNVLTHTEYQASIGGFADKPLEDAQNALVSARSSLSQARSDFELAQKDLDRKKRLLQLGLIAQADFEVSEDGFEKAQTNLEATQESEKLAQQAVARETKAFRSQLYSNQQVEQAQTAYQQAVLQRNAAETALRLAKTQILRDVQQAQNAYEAASFDSQNAHRSAELLGHPSAGGEVTIRSPLDGIITERDVSPGQIVDQSQMAPWQMFVVSDPRTIWVDADVYEDDIAMVRVGSDVQIHVGALPDKSFEGTVLRISPTVDKTTRSFKVRAEIRNPSGELKDGEYADVSIPLGIPHEGIFLPMSSVEHEATGDYVFLDRGNQFIKTKVEIKTQGGQRCEVLRGLKPGDRIAVKGAIFLGGQLTDD